MKLISHIAPVFEKLEDVIDEMLREANLLKYREINEDIKEIYDINKEYPILEEMQGLDTKTFVERISEKISASNASGEESFEPTERWLISMMRSNPELPLCKAILALDCDVHNKCLLDCDVHNKCLLLLMIADYKISPEDSDGISLGCIHSYFPYEYKNNQMLTHLWHGDHILQQKGLIAFYETDTYIDRSFFIITDKTKALINED